MLVSMIWHMWMDNQMDIDLSHIRYLMPCPSEAHSQTNDLSI